MRKFNFFFSLFSSFYPIVIIGNIGVYEFLSSKAHRYNYIKFPQRLMEGVEERRKR